MIYQKEEKKYAKYMGLFFFLFVILFIMQTWIMC